MVMGSSRWEQWREPRWDQEAKCQVRKDHLRKNVGTELGLSARPPQPVSSLITSSTSR